MQDQVTTSAQPARQRRYVALLYADLCGSTRLATELEPELYAEILDALKAIYREVIPKYDGTLLQVHGDGQMSMFGYPHAGEEDVRLAVDAALALHERVRALHLHAADLPAALQLRLHTGVHAGLALVQEGDIHGGSFELRGDVTNICARLSEDAGEDEVLVCSESLRGSEPFYVLGEPRLLSLKGVQTPMLAYPVRKTSGLKSRYQARRQRSRLPFLGRTDELAQLWSVWRSTRSSQVELTYLVGAPGVGKTRLADEFLSALEAQGQTVMRGFCDARTSAQPLEPFLNMLPDLSAIADLDANLARGITGFLEDPSKLDDFIQSYVAFIRQRAQQSPLVLFIDDWQWADETSQRLLGVLVKLEALPLMLLLATRAVDAGEREMLLPTATLELDGLDDDALSTAIAALLPAVDPFVARQIGAMSGGNPLFVEELCQASDLDKLDARPSAVPHAPQWLYSLVQARFMQLSEEQRRIVQVAAVVGEVAPLWLLKNVGEFDDPALLSGPILLDLLYQSEQGDEWRFKHGLTRAIVYDLVGLRERQRLHRAIAQSLLDHPSTRELPHERLAYHFAEAGMHEEAIEHAQQAGERAMLAPALDIARSQFRIAFELLDDGDIELPVYEQLLAVARRLSYAAIFDPSRDELPVFRRTLELARAREDVKGQANANYWLGRVFYGLGQPRRALHYFFQARTLAQDCGFERLVLETDVTLGQATAANCQHDAAVRLLEKATAARGEVLAKSPQAAGTAYALGCLGMVLGDQGHFAKAEEKFAAAKALLGGAGNPTEANILAKLAVVQIWSLQYEAAVTTAEQVGAVSEQIKNLYLFGMSRMLGAYARWRMAQDPTHIEAMQSTTEWLERQRQGQFLSLNYAHLAEAYARRGDANQARRWAAKALRRARAGDGFGLAVTHRALAELATQAQWPRDPSHYLAAAQRSAALRNSPREMALNEDCAKRLGVALDGA